MNTETLEKDKTLSTSDVAAAPDRPQDQRDMSRPTTDEREQTADQPQQPMPKEGEQLAPLFANDIAGDFRSRWDSVQIGFVDDPKQAVRQADELVAQVMKSLAESFSDERARIEGQLDKPDTASTENLRMALRRYRSFFDRLLSL